MTYRLHVFMCENRRDDGRACCANRGASDGIKFLRRWLKNRNLHGHGRIRVNRAGCMDRCALGPTLVVYPDAVWYRYDGENDLAEIAEQHLLNGQVVPRLRLADANSGSGSGSDSRAPRENGPAPRK